MALCAGNSPVPGEIPAQRPVTRSFDVFFDLRLNKKLSKQSWGWWFETLSGPLWRHRNESESLFTIKNMISLSSSHSNRNPIEGIQKIQDPFSIYRYEYQSVREEVTNIISSFIIWNLCQVIGINGSRLAPNLQENDSNFKSVMRCQHSSSSNGPLARYVNLRVAHAPGMPGTFFPPPRFSDPDMHHGTCVTHVPWCM